MRNYLFSIALSFLIIPAIGFATEFGEITINATAPAGHHFQGHNQYTSLVTFKGNIYVFSMDGDRIPYINKIDETDPNRIETGRLDPVNGTDLLTGTYHVFDDGHHRFTIGVDEEGYIHVFGDMHHGNLGSGRDDSTTNPLPSRFNGSIGDQMYWISDSPEDVSSFTFVGFDANKALPCNDLTYEHIETDNNGRIYIVSRQSVRLPRSHIPGTMGLSLWRYSISTKKWEELGGIPVDDYGFTGEDDTLPSIMWEPHGYGRTDVWYQGYFSSMKFDANNRLHLLCAINADSVFNGATNVLYAYSDDGGDTFLRRDGTSIASLPIRVTGPAANQGTILMTQGVEDDFHSSYMGLFWDANSNPAFTYKHLTDGRGYYAYYDTASQKVIAHNSIDSTHMDGQFVSSLRADPQALNNGSFVFFGTTMMWHQQGFTGSGLKYDTDFNASADWEGRKYFMREVDDAFLRSGNRLRGLSVKNGEGIIISIPYDVPTTSPLRDDQGP